MALGAKLPSVECSDGPYLSRGCTTPLSVFGCCVLYGGRGRHKVDDYPQTQRCCRTRSAAVRRAATPSSKLSNSSIYPYSVGTMIASTA